MENLDLAVLRALHRWRACERRALLATVVRTWGSSPRPVGSILALREDGAIAGSVSGGCIEDDLIHCFVHAMGSAGIPRSAPQLVCYGVTADEAHRFGLPCGGTLELLLEFNPDAASLGGLVDRLHAGALGYVAACALLTAQPSWNTPRSPSRCGSTIGRWSSRSGRRTACC